MAKFRSDIEHKELQYFVLFYLIVYNCKHKTSLYDPCRQLYLTIYQLPDGSDYTCVFPELNTTSPAEYWAYGVYCRAPDISQSGLQVKGEPW